MQTRAGATLNAPEHASSDAKSEQAPPGRSNRLVAALVCVAVVGYVADQASKAWVVANMDMGELRDLPGPILQLRRTANPGAAFSLATNATWLLTIVAIVVIGATIWAARTLRSRGWSVALGLLIGGALGNLTDRFLREPGGGQGHVVDFFQFVRFPVIDFPIFNVADICITSAATLICILALRGVNIDGTRAGEDDAGTGDVGDDSEHRREAATNDTTSKDKNPDG